MRPVKRHRLDGRITQRHYGLMFSRKMLTIIGKMAVMCLRVLITSKAFDIVDYWLLCSKLIDTDPSVLCFAATRLLAFWYTVIS